MSGPHCFARTLETRRQFCLNKYLEIDKKLIGLMTNSKLLAAKNLVIGATLGVEIRIVSRSQ